MLNTALMVWFVLTIASTVYVAYDLRARTPAMGVMKLGWILVLLYTRGRLASSCTWPHAGGQAERATRPSSPHA